MSRIPVVLLLLAACSQNWLTGEDPPAPDAPPMDPFQDAPPQRPALAESYSVTWAITSVIDLNGEGGTVMCPSVYCAPLTETTALRVSKRDDGLRFVFAKGAALTYVDAALDLERSGDVWVTTVAERLDAVGTRHAFPIVQDASGKFTGSVEWLAKGTMPATDDDLYVTFGFAAIPKL